MAYIPKNAEKTVKTTVFVKEISKFVRNFVIVQIVVDIALLSLVAYLLSRLI